jgi:hypothetical protein
VVIIEANVFKKAIIEVAHLSEQEVRYLMNLFTEKLN